MSGWATRLGVASPAEIARVNARRAAVEAVVARLLDARPWGRYTIGPMTRAINAEGLAPDGRAVSTGEVAAARTELRRRQRDAHS